MATKPTKKAPQGVVVYQAKNGAIELRGDTSRETVWATQADMARIFGVTPQNITLHLKNIYKEKELDERATCKESLQVQKEGKREVTRQVKEYNLDAMIAVGYRVGSVVGTRFRQWATKTLREHITRGYTINRSVVAKNMDAFLRTAEEMKALLPKNRALGDEGVLELVSFFANTWLSLDAYDKEAFAKGRTTKKKIALTAETFLRDVAVLKNELIKKGEATELFAAERSREAIEGIIGNVMQGFGGVDVYPSVEEKAAHLLYFVVKNHPFVDGNKRTGAYAFVWFLARAKILDRERISPSALTALTLLVAESDPKDKDRLIGLITMLLGLPKSAR
jgi:hypothetical protein